MFVFFRPTSDPKDVESVDEAGASFAAASLQQVCRFCEGWFRDVFFPSYLARTSPHCRVTPQNS